MALQTASGVIFLLSMPFIVGRNPLYVKSIIFENSTMFIKPIVLTKFTILMKIHYVYEISFFFSYFIIITKIHYVITKLTIIGRNPLLLDTIHDIRNPLLRNPQYVRDYIM